MTPETLIPKRLVVSVGELQFSDRPGDILIAPALGSCVALTLYDPDAVVGGIVHFMLPDSSVNSQRAEHNPGLFANVAIPLFFNRAFEMGVSRQRMMVKAAGGAQFLEERDFFAVGRRNVTMMRRILWQHGVPLTAENVGGTATYSLFLEVGTGRTWLRIGTEEVEL
jgi:chemotaxis protein CheD